MKLVNELVWPRFGGIIIMLFTVSENSLKSLDWSSHAFFWFIPMNFFLLDYIYLHFSKTHLAKPDKPDTFLNYVQFL